MTNPPCQLVLDFPLPTAEGGLIPHKGIALAMKALFTLSQEGDSLALVGPPHSGKTTLAQAWARAVGATWVSPQRLASQGGVAQLLTVGPEEAPKALLLEDWDQALGNMDQEQGLFHLFNYAQHGQLPSVWTSTRSAAAASFAVADLGSRLRTLPVHNILPPGDDDLEIITAKLFSDFQLSADASILTYIKNNGPRDIPGLRRVVHRLDQQVKQKKKKASLAMVRAILSVSSSSSVDEGLS